MALPVHQSLLNNKPFGKTVTSYSPLSSMIGSGIGRSAVGSSSDELVSITEPVPIRLIASSLHAHYSPSVLWRREPFCGVLFCGRFLDKPGT